MNDARDDAGPDEHEWGQLKPGNVRVEGDEIVIPLVEEVLVKKPVVREVLRIRKKTIVERRTVEADLRREDVEIDDSDLDDDPSAPDRA